MSNHLRKALEEIRAGLTVSGIDPLASRFGPRDEPTLTPPQVVELIDRALSFPDQLPTDYAREILTTVKLMDHRLNYQIPTQLGRSLNALDEIVSLVRGPALTFTAAEIESVLSSAAAQLGHQVEELRNTTDRDFVYRLCIALADYGNRRAKGEPAR